MYHGAAINATLSKTKGTPFGVPQFFFRPTPQTTQRSGCRGKAGAMERVSFRLQPETKDAQSATVSARRTGHRSVKKICQRHIFSVGRSGYAARRGTAKAAESREDRKRPPQKCDGLWKHKYKISALGELRSTTSGLQTVLLRATSRKALPHKGVRG